MLQRPATRLVAQLPKLTRPIASTSRALLPPARTRGPRSRQLRRTTPVKQTQQQHQIVQTPQLEPSTSLAPDDAPPVSRIPVEVPHDPSGVLDNASEPWAERARALFAQPAIVCTRQIEALNLIIGYEQANKYDLRSPSGELLGFLVEEDNSLGSSIRRQMLKTHRPFTATVLDVDGESVLLKIRRPFSWINSRIIVSAPAESGREEDEVVIGEAQSEWHIYRRKYHQFVNREGGMDQFGTSDSGFLAWDFTIRNEQGEPIGSINRNFRGLATELFMDVGAYVLRFEGVVDELNPALAAPETGAALPAPGPSDPSTPTVNASAAPPSKELSATASQSTSEISSVPAVVDLPSITYDQRAVMLAQAVSIDFDFFTRSRGGISPGLGMWMPIPMGGGAAGEAGEVAGAGEAVGGVAGESEPLPPTNEDEGESGYGGDGGGVGWGQEGGWGEETMEDPWANQGQEEGGTWNWGDLFPGDE